MKHFLLTVLAVLAVFLPAKADNLRLEDLTSGVYSARSITGVHPLNDGEQYSQISPDGQQIIARSFRTGEQTGVLLVGKQNRHRKTTT